MLYNYVIKYPDGSTHQATGIATSPEAYRLLWPAGYSIQSYSVSNPPPTAPASTTAPTTTNNNPQTGSTATPAPAVKSSLITLGVIALALWGLSELF